MIWMNWPSVRLLSALRGSARPDGQRLNARGRLIIFSRENIGECAGRELTLPSPSGSDGGFPGTAARLDWCPNTFRAAADHGLFAPCRSPRRSRIVGAKFSCIGLASAQTARLPRRLAVQNRRKVLRHGQVRGKQSGFQIVANTGVHGKARADFPRVGDPGMDALIRAALAVLIHAGESSIADADAAVNRSESAMMAGSAESSVGRWSSGRVANAPAGNVSPCESVCSTE